MAGPSRGLEQGERSRFVRRVILTVLVAGAALGATVLVARAGEVLLSLFAGVLFALFLSGTARAVQRWIHLPYGVVLALTVLSLLGLAVLTGLWLGPRVAAQLADLLERLPAAAGAVLGQERLNAWMRKLGSLRLPNLASEMSTALSTARGLITRAVQVVGGMVVVFFMGVYGAAQPEVYRRALLRLVPLDARPRAREVVEAVTRALQLWLFGRLVAMVFVGAATTVAFAALGIPLPLALGLVAGALSFVEYVGAIVSAIPAVLLALDKGPLSALWVLVVYSGVHLLEGYVITPFLARRTVRFPPAFTLAVQVLFGVFFGILGLVLATPVAAVLVLLVRMLYVEDALGDRPPPGAIQAPS